MHQSSSSGKLNKKLMELESENEALKDSIVLLKESHTEDIISLKNKYSLKLSEETGGHSINTILHKLKHTN